ARSFVCGKRASSTRARASVAIRSPRSWSSHPKWKTSAPRKSSASSRNCTRKIRAPICGRRCSMAKRSKAAFMISSVAEQYEIHPQTLRLYEREGLLKPSRSEGNTRLYTDDDLERLEVILHLTRDLGVNLAGVEIILNMREKMGEMQLQIQEFISTLNSELVAR